MKNLFFLAVFVASLFGDAHVFIYHRFDDAKHSSTSISTKELTKQFQYFKDNGYKVVPLNDILEKVKNKEEVPKKWVALNIDDSYKSFLQNGLKIFKKFNYPFTMFVYVKATNKKYRDFLSWNELKELKKYGDIQYHSYAHANMVRLNDKDLRKDFEIGLSIFEKNMGYKATQFAYPYGAYDERVKKVAKSFGLNILLNQNNLGAVSKNSNLDDISRSALHSSTKFVLSLKDLNATFVSPVTYPKSKYVKNVVVKVDKKYKKVEIFVSKQGWKWVKVKDGIATRVINKKFKLNTIRMAVKTKLKEIKAAILVKTKYGRLK